MHRFCNNHGADRIAYQRFLISQNSQLCRRMGRVFRWLEVVNDLHSNFELLKQSQPETAHHVDWSLTLVDVLKSAG